MKTNRTIFLGLALAFVSGQSLFAAPLHVPTAGVPASTLAVPIAADCYALGQDKAAELGGELAKATAATDGDAPVCKLVIVVPGKDGERPKRVQVTVPQ
jgi:hypothetical protein